MEKWFWYNADEYLPPPGALVLIAEVIHDSGYPDGAEFLYPTVGWMNVDQTWRTREPGVMGGRVIQAARWTHIPPMEDQMENVRQDNLLLVNPIRSIAGLLGGWCNAER